MTIEEGAAALDLRLSREQLSSLDRHLRLLVQWNRRLDLVSPGSFEHLVERHFLDSLMLLVMARPAARWRAADIGSGAGFPGLVWAVVRADLHVTLVEPRRKRAAFLERVLLEAGTGNAAVVARRAEELHADPEHRAAYDLVVARAVAGYDRVVRAATPLVRLGGRIFVPLGPEASVSGAEIVEAQVPWIPRRTRRAACVQVPAPRTGRL
jgi:16S rRNA (guanine527-N7)-methyltransferase